MHGVRDAVLLGTQLRIRTISKHIPIYVSLCQPHTIAWSAIQMAFAASTMSDAHTTAKSSTTSLGPLGDLQAVSSALGDIEGIEQKDENSKEDSDLQLLASGGYNDVWLVSRPLQRKERYVIRKPKEDALLPDQVRNEVAHLTFVKENIQKVPVPQVFCHSLDGSATGTPFIAEEFIEGQNLSSVWSTFDEPTKLDVARQIAEVIVELGETTFDGIGGLMLDHRLGPTVEGIKLFKGRVSVGSLQLKALC